MIKQLFVILAISLYSFNSFAISTVNGKPILLLTAQERRLNPDYEALTEERAKLVCDKMNKQLLSFEYKELSVECTTKTCKTENCELIRSALIPIESGFKSPSEDALDSFYAGAVSLTSTFSLGIMEPRQKFNARMATDIQCGKPEDYEFK